MIKIKKLKLLKQLVIEIFKRYNEKHNIDGVISDNSITIKIFRGNRKEIYKKILVEEENNKLKIVIFPERIKKLVDINELEDIITILEKQSKIIKYTPEEINEIKRTYPRKTRIKLIKMYDLYAPKPGTKGIVERVDDEGKIQICWESGSSLSLIPKLDEFVICDN